MLDFFRTEFLKLLSLRKKKKGTKPLEEKAPSGGCYELYENYFQHRNLSELGH